MLSLRSRLALALAAAFLAVFAVILATHLETLDERQGSRAENLASINQTLAAQVDGFSKDLETFAQAVAITVGQATDGGAPVTQPVYERYLGELAASYNVRSVFLVDDDGIVLAGANANVGFDVSSRPYFQRLKGGANEVWSDALAGQLSGQTTLAYGRTVPAQSRVLYLVIAFYPAQLAERLPGLSEDSHVALFDKNGVLIYDSKRPEASQPAEPVISDENFARAAAGGSVTLTNERSPVDQGKVYGSFVGVPTSGWVVSLTRPASAIDQPLRNRFIRDTLILLSVVLVAYAAMYWLTGRLTRPLFSLAEAAQAITEGKEPTIPSGIKDPDAHRLSEAMTVMSQAVAEREEQLRLRARDLERANASQERLVRIISRLHSSRNALSPVLEDSEIASVILQEAVNALEADRGLVAISDDVTGRLNFLASHAYSQAFVELLNEMDDKSQGAFRTVLTERRPLFFSDAAAFTAMFPSSSALKAAAETQAVAIVPLVAHDLILGLLVISFNQSRTFSREDQELVEAFANQGAQALHRYRLFAAEKQSRELVEQSSKAKDEFLGILGHELRTPVTSIFGSARMLARRNGAIPEDAKTELIEVLESESERLVALIENLLLIARIDLGKTAEPKVFHLPRAIEATVERVMRRSPGRVIQLTMPEQQTTDLVGEQTSIEQITENFLTNAVKYSPATEPIELEVNLRNEELTVVCRDRGPGVLPSELELMFESFYRSADAPVAIGKGLGLTVCRRLAESMGGTTWARLREGGGLEVHLRIPVRRVSSSEEPGPDVSSLEGAVI